MTDRPDTPNPPNWIDQSDQLPRRGNRFTKAVAGALFRLFGWRVAGDLPNLPKMVVIGAPHDSNWDFLLAMNLIFYLGVHFNWMVKKEFFVMPFSVIWRWLGGIPVDRNAPKGLVGQTVEMLNQKSKVVLAIAPEGTRKKGVRWRTGFYHIGHNANIPIIPVLVDYHNKILKISEPFYPNGDVNNELPLIQARFGTLLNID